MAENKINVLDLPDGGTLSAGDTLLVIRGAGTETPTARRITAAQFREGLVDSYVDVMSPTDTTAYVDGKTVTVPAKRRTRLYPTTSFALNVQRWSGTSPMTFCDPTHLNTSAFTSAEWMFGGCQSLKRVDISALDTSKVTTMAYMFYNCPQLTAIDGSGGLDTSKVTNMTYMFYNCRKLTALDVSNWDVSNVTAMPYLFSACYRLAELDVSKWDVSNVTDMTSIFCNIVDIVTLDLSGWDVSKVGSMLWAIWNSANLTSLIGTHTLAEVEAGDVTALNGLSCDLHIAGCPKIERASLLAVINGMADLTGKTSRTLTLSGGLKAKLTEADIATATAKNWTVAG